MPYRRMYRPRRPYRKRRTTYKRKAQYYGYNRGKKPRNWITSAIFRQVLNAPIGNQSTNDAGSPNVGAIAPQLQDMPGSIAYTNLFAQYRINKVKVEFFPHTGSRFTLNEESTNTPFLSEKPLFATCINRVATSFSTNMAEMMTTSSVKYHTIGKKHTRLFTPVTFDQVFNEDQQGNPALNPTYKQWLSTNYRNIAHHGLNWCIAAANHIPQNWYQYRIVITTYCQFKNRRVYTGPVTEIPALEELK